MLISFFNPSDLIGCYGDINQSDSFRYVEGLHGGVPGGGTQRGYAEAVRGGGASLFVLGYHWLPIATIDLVGDNREFEV